MINLSAENKALCFADSTAKPLSLYMYQWVDDEKTMDGGYWKHFTTIKDAIVLESATIDEGILDGKGFELGSFVVPTMKVQWRNDYIRYKNFVCVPVQQIGDEFIAYMNGYVMEETLAEDGYTVTAKIVPYLYNTIDAKIKSYLDIEEFINFSFANVLYYCLNALGVFINPDKLMASFANAKTIIPNLADFPENMTVAELLRQSGEFLGGQVRVKSKRIVTEDEMLANLTLPYDEIEFFRLSSVESVADNETNPLPSEYLRLEYLQSTGTQFIDTGYYPTDKTYIEIKQAFLYSQANGETATMGTLGGGYARATIGYISSSYNSFFCHCGTELSRFNTAVEPNERPHIFEWSGDGYFAVDNNISHHKGSVTQTFISPTTFYLFKRNEALDVWCPIKTYYCKMWENGVLTRHLIPCMRKADGVLGMFDLVNSAFYTNGGTGNFLSGGQVESFALPYYINLVYDKTQTIAYNVVTLKTETGNQLYYESNYNILPRTFNTARKEYNIRDNFFYEKISEDNRQDVLDNVAHYLDSLNFYYCDLSGIYPPFIEGGDYLIYRSKNTSMLPSGFSSLEYINAKVAFDTGIYPNVNNAEIKIDFALTDAYTTLFSSDGSGDYRSTMAMYYDASTNSLIGKMGYYGGSVQSNAFEITPVLLEQRTSLNIYINGSDVVYKGFYNGNGTIWSGVLGGIGAPLYVGDNGNGYNLYKFEYYEGGQKILDLYPCRRDSDGVVGLFDTVSGKFITTNSTEYLGYETSDIIVPVLAVNSKGIHSMRADIMCQATEI